MKFHLIGLYIHAAITFILIWTAPLMAWIVCGPLVIGIVWNLERTHGSPKAAGYRTQLLVLSLVAPAMIALATYRLVSWVF